MPRKNIDLPAAADTASFIEAGILHALHHKAPRETYSDIIAAGLKLQTAAVIQELLIIIGQATCPPGGKPPQTQDIINTFNLLTTSDFLDALRSAHDRFVLLVETLSSQRKEPRNVQ